MWVIEMAVSKNKVKLSTLIKGTQEKHEIANEEKFGGSKLISRMMSVLLKRLEFKLLWHNRSRFWLSGPGR